MEKFEQILKDVENYYSDKITHYGPTPRGVDWSTEESQKLRFSQFLSLIKENQNFSINDLGCGYGAYGNFLKSITPNFRYFGADISKEMLNAASEHFASDARFNWIQDPLCLPVSNYTIASGIFNVKLSHNEIQWTEYVFNTIELMNEKSQNGFAFNMLTSYSDTSKMRPDLFYADPCLYFDWCKKHYSKNVALLHDYNLFEFTLIVRK